MSATQHQRDRYARRVWAAEHIGAQMVADFRGQSPYLYLQPQPACAEIGRHIEFWPADA